MDLIATRENPADQYKAYLNPFGNLSGQEVMKFILANIKGITMEEAGILGRNVNLTKIQGMERPAGFDLNRETLSILQRAAAFCTAVEIRYQIASAPVFGTTAVLMPLPDIDGTHRLQVAKIEKYFDKVSLSQLQEVREALARRFPQAQFIGSYTGPWEHATAASGPFAPFLGTQRVAVRPYVVSWNNSSDPDGDRTVAARLGLYDRRVVAIPSSERGYMGVQLQAPGAAMSDQGENMRNQGVGPVVQSVTPGGPADKAGVQAGDVISRIDGIATTTVNDVLTSMRRASAGQIVALTLLRSGQEHRVRLELGNANIIDRPLNAVRHLSGHLAEQPECQSSAPLSFD